MKPEIKVKWIEALRSGRYKQGKDYLRVASQYCCLGVLCEIEGETIRDNSRMPPISFLNRIGLSTVRADMYAEMNDAGDSFSLIADEIEWQ